MEIDKAMYEKYLKLLNEYGVTNVELRVLYDESRSILSKIFPTTDVGIKQINEWIIKHHLREQTINCTFNKLSDRAVANQKPIKDCDIDEVRFLFVDIDPIRTTKTSSTESEKEQAFDLMTEVSEFLEKSGVDEQLILDSGNGYHLLLPIETGVVSEVKELSKQFLKALNQQFSNDHANIATSVSNPARLGKLIGCVAAKGSETEERPIGYLKLLRFRRREERVIRLILSKQLLIISAKKIKV